MHLGPGPPGDDGSTAPPAAARENFLRFWPKSLAELRVVLSEHGVYDVERGWATSDLGANRELRKRQAQQYAGKDQQHTPNQRQSTYPVGLTHDDPSSARLEERVDEGGDRRALHEDDEEPEDQK